MKVFMNKRQGDYTGGMLLVAANSAQEAHEVFHADERFAYYWDEMDGVVYDSYYLPENWQEVPNLEYHGETPCVIEEEGYAE